MKLNALLTSVLTGLGVDTNSAEAQALLGNANLASVEVADELSNKLKGPFFTKEAALASPEIRSVIKAETLNGIDSQIDEVMKTHLTDEDIAELKKESKTLKRLSNFTEKIKELEAKKANATGKTQSELTKQIDALNLEKSKLVQEHQAKILELEQARKMDKVNWEHDSFYGELDYALPKEMPKEIKIETAKAIINRKMKEKGLRFEAGENGIEILTNEGTKYVDNNNFVSNKDFIKKSLLEAKLLQVTDASSKSQQVQSSKTHVQHANNSFTDALNSRLRETQVG